jgi:hypothetical protein
LFPTGPDSWLSIERACVTPPANPKLQQRTKRMKHLLTGVAMTAALAFAAPAWAQNPSPSGGNPMGMPGPSPGGPGLTPYSTGIPQATDTTSAMPPKHRHARAHHAAHGKMAGHHRAPGLTGSSANQLNQEELARLQAGNFSNPPAPPSPGVPTPRGSARSPSGGPRTD